MKNTVAINESSSAMPTSGTRSSAVSQRGAPNLFSAVRPPNSNAPMINRNGMPIMAIAGSTSPPSSPGT
ncbi:hypothetical protein D3C77_598850 [compost metagenome]